MLVGIADLTSPDPVQSVNVTYARDAAFCASLISGSNPEAGLLMGDLDASGAHEPLPLLTPSSRPVDPVQDRWPAIKGGATFFYVRESPISFEETRALPPMPGVDLEEFDGATKDAWRHALVRESQGGRLRECEFVTRRIWFNFAI